MGQIYPGLRHTIKIFLATVKIFLATVTVATLILVPNGGGPPHWARVLACFIYRSHIRIRVPLYIMPAFFSVEII